jgi:hypothetical protein
MIDTKAALSLDEGDHMPMLEKMVSHKSIEGRVLSVRSANQK